jgi:predicted phosphodiesterase
MRIAIITDIHEDFHMLEKASGALKQRNYDVLICLGDITGFSPLFYAHKPDANSCIDWLRQNANVSIPGNHDLYSVQRLPSYYTELDMPENWYNLTSEQQQKIGRNRLWLYEQEAVPELSPENRLYLKNLPEYYILEEGHRKILFTHFLSPDICGTTRWFPYRIGETSAHTAFMRNLGCSLSFAGHSHPNGVCKIGRFFWNYPVWESIKVKQSRTIILCPPLVSGRDFNSFLIFDTTTNIIEPIFL